MLTPLDNLQTRAILPLFPFVFKQKKGRRKLARDEEVSVSFLAVVFLVFKKEETPPGTQDTSSILSFLLFPF